jgi:hypothetical protein
LTLLTLCNYTLIMIMELLAHKDYLRILQAVRRRPMRFGELQKALDLNPAQVDRAVKFLLIEYELGKRGAAFLESFKAFSVGAIRRKAELGLSVVAELRSFTR